MASTASSGEFVGPIVVMTPVTGSMVIRSREDWVTPKIFSPLKANELMFSSLGYPLSCTEPIDCPVVLSMGSVVIGGGKREMASSSSELIHSSRPLVGGYRRMTPWEAIPGSG